MSQAYDTSREEWVGFVKAARLKPADDTPLLSWADWLSDAYPGMAFEQLLRDMTTIARVNPCNAITNFGWLTTVNPTSPGGGLMDRAWVNFQRTWRNWEPFKGNETHLMRQCLVHRGLMLRVVCDQDYWHEYADAICAFGPVGEVIFVDDVDFWVRVGETVVYISPNHQKLMKRLPHDEDNPHYTRVLHAPDWRSMSRRKQLDLMNHVGCLLYGMAWLGRVGSFRVNGNRGRRDFTADPDDVPLWPAVLA